MQSNVFTSQGQVYLGCNSTHFFYNDFVRLQQLGEFGLIARIASSWKNQTPPSWVGIGDDCAVLSFPPNSPHDATKLLVTTDMLVEGIHFLSTIPPTALGYKALAVNLSDLAAMGGTPMAAFLSLALPSEIPVAWIDSFFEGFNQLAQGYNVVLAGGDTNRSPGPMVVNVTLLGQAHPSCLKTRRGTQTGDIICVTGALGNSAGGLQLLLKHSSQSRTAAEHWLLQQHHCPRPHLEEGKWLAQKQAVHALIDVSDGIDSDLHHLLSPSQKDAHIDLRRLPLSPQLQEVAATYQWDAITMAVTAGEDYCLLCTVEAQAYPDLARQYAHAFGHPLVPIGTVTEGNTSIHYLYNGHPVDIKSHGFDHFLQ